MKKPFAALAILLAGCATTQSTWNKPGSSAQDFYQDDGQCKAQAFSVATGNMMQIAIVHNSCMRGKGWYLQ